MFLSGYCDDEDRGQIHHKNFAVEESFGAWWVAEEYCVQEGYDSYYFKEFLLKILWNSRLNPSDIPGKFLTEFLKNF